MGGMTAGSSLRATVTVNRGGPNKETGGVDGGVGGSVLSGVTVGGMTKKPHRYKTGTVDLRVIRM